MAISQSRYVAITSGIGGQAAASRKNMGTRVISTNSRIPTGQILEFSGAASEILKNVGAYFGTQSNEYAFAAKQCAYVSNAITQINMISYARFTPEAVAPMLIPTKNAAALSAFTSISAGSLTVSLNGVSYEMSNINLSESVSLAAVATTLTNKIHENAGGGAMFTNATVQFENGVFVLTGGETGVATVEFADNGELATALRWNKANAPILSNGAAAETAAAAMDRITNVSNNFASFVFLPALTETADIEAVSNWATAQNMQFAYSIPVTKATYSDVIAVTAGGSATILTDDENADYAEYMPCVMGATTNYNAVNGTISPMFKQFPNDKPSVEDDATANLLDPANVNYLGLTQQAGKGIAFYQRGYTQDGTDIAVLFNEIWLKDAITTQAFNLFLALNKVPANEDGVSLLTTALTSIFDEAKTNGVISVGKTLTTTQKAYIDQITGETESWRTVQENGYIFIPVLSQQTIQGKDEWVFTYTLIYGKGDSIRKVVGSDILI